MTMTKITIEKVNKKINSWPIEKVNAWFRKLDFQKQVDFLEGIFSDLTIYNMVEKWEIFLLKSFEKKKEDLRMRIKTPNISFNDAWKFLQEKSGLSPIAQTYCIDISKKPKLTKEEWHSYIGSLVEVILIGQRNKWISIHVDGKGRTAYLVLSYPITKDFLIKDKKEN